MSPILGIFASQGRVASTSYESIATTTVGAGGSSSITFSSISSDFTHLQIRGIGKTTGGTGFEWLTLSLNGGSTAISRRHSLYGTGAAAVAESGTQTWFAEVSSTDGTSMFGALVLDLLDYKNTNKYKTIRTLWGSDKNGSGELGLNSNLWESTSAVTSITLACRTNNFAQYSSFALYGIK